MSHNISKRSIFAGAAIIFAIALISFALFGLLPVRRDFKAISASLMAQKSPDKQTITKEREEMIEKIISLKHNEALLKSALDLSKGDSISLLINIKDSIATLSFKGVTLFNSKISYIYLSKGLKKLPLSVRDSLLSAPLEVKEELASIEKYPVVIKKAPKDTTEANIESAPILPVQNDVFVLFSFENRVILEINQKEKRLAGSKAAWRAYKREYRDWFLRKNLLSLKNPDSRSYNYRIEIQLAREDARSIYRALPLKPNVVIALPRFVD
ncbi:MAG: hypothetical protein Q8R90_09500 [Bacteroidales bacterium]|nr:hypothetical protein [Bacteroidales bacterium]